SVNRFVTNAAATWSLINKTGGVANTDLAPAPGNKSAVFTGNAGGSAQIQAVADSFTGTSGTITVDRPPAVDLNGGAAGIDFAATFTEDGGAVAIVASGALTVTDADGGNLASAGGRI